MKKLLLGFVRGLFASIAQAAAILPLNYTVTAGEGQAQGGIFNYFDDTGRQLIDGTRGVNDWTANLGNGNAYEWVGWRVANPGFTFNFGSVVSISSITIGLNRTEGAAIFAAISGSAGGNPISIPGNAFADGTRSDLLFTFANPVVGSTFQMSLTDGNTGRWIFVDEITFDGTGSTSVIPLPGTLALMFPALALIGVFARRRAQAS